MKNRMIALFTTILLFVYAFPVVNAASAPIYIKTADDFISLTQKCTLDSWSIDKTIELSADIDLSDSDTVPIPIFGGTFHGNGHKISGVHFSESGSHVGLFRYVSAGGTVCDLSVEGDLVPDGTKSFVGGIAGENAGTIENCTFSGTVRGENVIGGIAGMNAASGTIRSCSAKGTSTGENSTGGIAGKNEGLISSSDNRMSVNTTYEEKQSNITDIDADAGAIVETYQSNREENEEESILGHSDTGGIAGYTSGILQGCTNHGAIGYPHVGYNVGGIAGRQSGFMTGCTNYGNVLGRKDVGGIVGQMEPYLLLKNSGSSIGDIRSELDVLNRLVGQLTNDADALGDDTNRHLSAVSAHTALARDNAKIMVDESTGFVNQNIDEANVEAALLSDTISRISPALQAAERGADTVSSALDEIASAADSLSFDTPDLSADADKLSEALRTLGSAGRALKTAATKARRAGDDLSSAVTIKDRKKAKAATDDLAAAIADLESAKNTIQTSLTTIEAVLKLHPESTDEIGINTQTILENLNQIKETNETAIQALNTLKKSLDTLLQNIEIEFSEFGEAADDFDYAMDSLSRAFASLAGSMDEIADAISSGTETLNEYSDTTSEELKTFWASLSHASGTLSYAADDLADATGTVSQALSDYSANHSFEFHPISEEFKSADTALFESLSGISDELASLRSSLSQQGKAITRDLKRVSDQFNVVMNLFLGELEGLGERDELSDLFLDVSEDDISNSKEGKVTLCTNYGTIEADRNTGGIAGSLAIEYAVDPEDELKKPSTLNFVYQTRAVLSSCVNQGTVTGKKDCVGGIAGLAELGSVYKCENYQNAQSTNGDYVGGIAGKCDTNLKKCYSKASMEGRRYVGGIAGKGEIVSASYAIATVRGEEMIGAVCGNADRRDRITQNYFVDEGTGGIDGISYDRAAEPISYNQLVQISGIPKHFISFSVTFLADGQTIETQDIKYGSSTDRIRYPEVPNKEGFFGHWEIPSEKTVTTDITLSCNYSPYLTTIKSEEQDATGARALGLAEGEFTDEAVLHITESSAPPCREAHFSPKTYDIHLADTKNVPSSLPLRIANSDKAKVTAWVQEGDNWKPLTVHRRGKYAVLDNAPSNGTICVEYEPRSMRALLWLLLIPFAGIGILSYFILQKRKKK